MIPNDGLSGMFYRLRNDNALFAKATNNVGNHLEDLQGYDVGAHAFLEDNGTATFGSVQDLMDDPTYKPYGKLYVWADAEVDANYLSDKVDVRSVVDNMQKNNDFDVFKSYVSEVSDQLLDVIPYVRENGGHDENGSSISSVNVGIKLSANSKEEFYEGLNNLKNWEQENNASNNFNHEIIDENKEFSLFD